MRKIEYTVVCPFGGRGLGAPGLGDLRRVKEKTTPNVVFISTPFAAIGALQ